MDSDSIWAGSIAAAKNRNSCIPYPIWIQYLDAATQPQDLAAVPTWRLHELKGNQVGRWSITVNGNWRLTFTFEGADVVLLDYEDYHLGAAT